MTDQEINELIAQKHGYRDIHVEDGSLLDGAFKGLLVGKYGTKEYDCAIPSYTTSLDSTHEAEKVLTPAQRITFIHALCLDVLKLCPLGGDYWMADELDSWAMSHATARQRAEAFLRTFNLWKD